MNDRAQRKRILAGLAVVFLTSFHALADDTWLTVKGSDEVEIKNYGFFRYNGDQIFVVVVPGAQPDDSFFNISGAYRFSNEMVDTYDDMKAIRELVGAAALAGKKFRIGVNAGNQIVKILVVN